MFANIVNLSDDDIIKNDVDSPILQYLIQNQIQPLFNSIISSVYQKQQQFTIVCLLGLVLFMLYKNFSYSKFKIPMNFYSTFNSFAPAFYYDNNDSLSELQDFPPSDEPVYILGIKYSSLHELDDIRNDVRTRIWLTYRRNFPSIGDSGMTSDSGWGCMLRAGQMVLAQAFCNYHLGRNWKWDYSSQLTIQKLMNDESSAKELENYCKYRQIIKLFADLKTAPYSIHQIALMGACEGKNIGEWFGPNTVAQVLKKLSVYDKFNDCYIHVAMDNMVFTDDIKRLCKSSVRIGNKVSLQKSSESDSSEDEKWRPLVLFIPLRLGLTEINPVYFRALKSTFAFPQSLGILGGRPNHALYFIGCCGDSLVYLDPHTTQPALSLDNDICQKQQRLEEANNANTNCDDKTADLSVETNEIDSSSSSTTTSSSSLSDFESDDISYHCDRASRMSITYLDPSIALCFLCKTEEEFDQWANLTLRKLIHEEKQPLFEIMKERPGNWPSLEDDIEMDALSLNDSSSNSSQSKQQQQQSKNPTGNSNAQYPDSFTDLEDDEDYEIID